MSCNEIKAGDRVKYPNKWTNSDVWGAQLSLIAPTT